MSKEIKELLNYLLGEISYLRTHTDEIDVLAGLNLMEQKIKSALDCKGVKDE